MKIQELIKDLERLAEAGYEDVRIFDRHTHAVPRVDHVTLDSHSNSVLLIDTDSAADF